VSHFINKIFNFRLFAFSIIKIEWLTALGCSTFSFSECNRGEDAIRIKKKSLLGIHLTEMNQFINHNYFVKIGTVQAQNSVSVHLT